MGEKKRRFEIGIVPAKLNTLKDIMEALLDLKNGRHYAEQLVDIRIGDFKSTTQLLRVFDPADSLKNVNDAVAQFTGKRRYNHANDVQEYFIDYITREGMLGRSWFNPSQIRPTKLRVGDIVHFKKNGSKGTICGILSSRGRGRDGSLLKYYF